MDFYFFRDGLPESKSSLESGDAKAAKAKALKEELSRDLSSRSQKFRCVQFVLLMNSRSSTAILPLSKSTRLIGERSER